MLAFGTDGDESIFLYHEEFVQQVLEVGCVGSIFILLDLHRIHSFSRVNNQCCGEFMRRNVLVTSHFAVFLKFLGISSRCVIHV